MRFSSSGRYSLLFHGGDLIEQLGDGVQKRFEAKGEEFDHRGLTGKSDQRELNLARGPLINYSG